MTANPAPAGQVFDQWTGAPVANPAATTTTLIMPGAATAVVATYKPQTFALSVTSGSGAGTYPAGTSVLVTANPAPAGQMFDQWTGAAVANPAATTTTLIMPGAATAVVATYKPQTFALTVTSGSGSGNYPAGTSVLVTANPAPAGQVFDQWTGATVANPTATTTTLIMPAAATAVVAVYKAATPNFALTVTQGSGSGLYPAGTVVNITAQGASAGQIFDQWIGAAVANGSAPATTLVMPAADVTVTALFEPLGVAVNQPPTASPQSVLVHVNTPAAVTLTGSDPDGDPLTFLVASGPQFGALSGTPPNVIYTPNPEFLGSDTFTFVARDGVATSAAASVALNVAPAGTLNTPPSTALTQPSDGGSFSAGATISLSATASDTDGSVFQVSFYANGVRLGEVSTAPYTFQWPAVPAGTYILTSKVTDDQGSRAYSPPVTILVTTAPSAPNSP